MGLVCRLWDLQLGFRRIGMRVMMVVMVMVVMMTMMMVMVTVMEDDRVFR